MNGSNRLPKLFLSAFCLFEVRFLKICSLYIYSPPRNAPPSTQPSSAHTFAHVCTFHLSLSVCLSDTHTLPVSLFSFSSSWQVVLRGPSQLAVGYISHKSLSIWVKSENNRPLRKRQTHTHTQNANTEADLKLCVSVIWASWRVAGECWFYVTGCTVCRYVYVEHLWVYMCSCNKKLEPGATTESLHSSIIQDGRRLELIELYWCSTGQTGEQYQRNCCWTVANHLMNHHHLIRRKM